MSRSPSSSSNAAQPYVPTLRRSQPPHNPCPPHAVDHACPSLSSDTDPEAIAACTHPHCLPCNDSQAAADYGDVRFRLVARYPDAKSAQSLILGGRKRLNDLAHLDHNGRPGIGSKSVGAMHGGEGRGGISQSCAGERCQGNMLLETGSRGA